MKKFLKTMVVVLMAVSLSSGQSVFFPHSHCCNCFYHCSNGVAYLKYCPANLHWNVFFETCDFPEIAKCHPIGIYSCGNCASHIYQPPICPFPDDPGGGNPDGGTIIPGTPVIIKAWFYDIPTTRTAQEGPLTRFAVLGNNIWPCEEWPNRVSQITQFRTCYVTY
jgi:hypothetical protein